MSNQPNGGPAFPVLDNQTFCGEGDGHGMTLRDYFAAKAMQGSLADPNVDPTDHKGDFARWCYEVADAMIAARGEGQ